MFFVLYLMHYFHAVKDTLFPIPELNNQYIFHALIFEKETIITHQL